MNSIFDYFSRSQVPDLILCTPNGTPIQSLKGAYEVHHTPRYNAMGELSFIYPKSKDNGETFLPAYDYIKNKKMVLVKGMGYYIISECSEDATGSIPVKNVVCYSAEEAMNHKRLTGFTIDPIQLYDATDASKSLLDVLLKYYPTWSVDYIDPYVLTDTDGVDLYRGFEVDNNTLYSFLVEDVETAYNCVIIFDRINKTISAYAIDSLDDNTGVFLSFNNANLELHLEEFSDEMTTALYCFGGKDLDVRRANPLGKNVIYNFDYYKTTEWMSQDLIDALDAWETKIANSEEIFAEYGTDYASAITELAELDTKLTDLESALAGYNTTYEADKAGKLDTDEVEDSIKDTKSEIATQNELIATKEEEAAVLQGNMEKIARQLEFTSKINFENFIVGLNSIYSKLETISTNWNSIYFINSTVPSFDADVYDVSVGEVVGSFNLVFDELNYLIELSKDIYLDYYNMTNDDKNSIKTSINNLIIYLNTTYDLFSGMIQNTTTTRTLTSVMISLGNYLEILDYESNFTEDQYLRLQEFVFENTYTNNNIITTNVMTEEEIQVQIQSLYNQSKNVLERASKPRYEVNGNFANVLSLPEFSDFIEKIDLGKIINVEINDGRVLELALLEMEFYYDDPASFNMIFSNRPRINNSNFQFADMFLNSAETASGVSGL